MCIVRQEWKRFPSPSPSAHPLARTGQSVCVTYQIRSLLHMTNPVLKVSPCYLNIAKHNQNTPAINWIAHNTLAHQIVKFSFWISKARLLSCHLASCHTCTCHLIVITNVVVECNPHVRKTSWLLTWLYAHILWSSRDPQRTHAR